jgi:hypothetical protein
MRKFVFFSVIVLICMQVFAEITTWTGNVSRNWHDAGNWNNGVPDQTMDAVIPNSSSYARHPEISSGDAPCASLSNDGNLFVQNDHSLNVQNNCTCGSSGILELFNGNASVGGTMENNGHVIVNDDNAAGSSSLWCDTFTGNNGSTTELGAQGTMTSNNLTNHGTVIMSAGAFTTNVVDFDATGEFNQSGGNFSVTDGGIFQSGSSLDLSGNASFRYDADISFDGSATIDGNASVWTGGSGTPNFSAGSNSTVNVNGGWFSIQNFITNGTLNVDGGNAYFQETTNNGTFTVVSGGLNSGGLFTNNGTFN